MTDIVKNLEAVRANLKPGVKLIAVTKTRSPEEINTVIDAGVTDIGENKVQEILEKYDKVKDVNWHMIGHLQTNKVKSIIDKVKMIHSVDSLKLAQEIDLRAYEAKTTMDILIEVNVANDPNKYGYKYEYVDDLVRMIMRTTSYVYIKGFMCVLPFTDDTTELVQYCMKMKALYDGIREKNFGQLDIQYLSMGMTNDYQIAVEAGSNMVRIGSAIFGERQY